MVMLSVRTNDVSRLCYHGSSSGRRSLSKDGDVSAGATVYPADVAGSLDITMTMPLYGKINIRGAKSFGFDF